MMEKVPTHLRADATEGKEQGRNQNKKEEPPGHDLGEVEAFCQWLLATAMTASSISASFILQPNDKGQQREPAICKVRIATRRAGWLRFAGPAIISYYEDGQ